MEKIAPEVYSKIDNDLYNEKRDVWWDPETVLHILKTSVNSWRVGVANDVFSKLSLIQKEKKRLKWVAGGDINRRNLQDGLYHDGH